MAIQTFHHLLPITTLPPRVSELEASLLALLPKGAALLRWAIVGRSDTAASGGDYWLCEGAYQLPSVLG